MAYLTTPLPDVFLTGAVFSPMYSTTTARTTGGKEYRNQNWAYPKVQGQVSIPIMTYDDLIQVQAFFHAAAGSFNYFPVKCPNDFWVMAGEVGPTIDGAPTKAYTFGGQTRYRRLTRSYAVTTELIEINGVWTAPSLCFYTPMRIEDDSLSMNLQQIDIGQVLDLKLIEVFE